MNLSQDKENEISMFLDLNFNKKQKQKPKTDRINTLSNSNLKNNNITQINNSSTISLIQKKKLYSQNVRSKHFNTTARKIKQEYYGENQLTQTPIDNNYISLQENSEVDKGKTKSKGAPRYDEQNIKGNSKVNTREKIKNKKIAYTIEEIKIYTDTALTKTDKDNKRDFQSKKQLKQVKKQDKMIKKPQKAIVKHDNFCQTKKQLIFVPLQVNQTVLPSITEQMKEIQLLQKQNATYKKQLANYRKETGGLKRQIESFKKKIQELSEKNNYLINQNQDQIKILQNFELRVSASFDQENLQENKGSRCLLTNSGQKITDWDDIIKNYEKQLFQSASKVKQLEFKNYMLEKKILDESEYHKKVMAKEVSNWKQRYIRARNQNMRLKDSRNSALFDMSISTEM